MSRKQKTFPKLFENQQLWNSLIEETKLEGGHIDKVIESQIRTGKINPCHRTLLDKNRKNLEFKHRNSPTRFDNLELLRQHFFNMSEKNRNGLLAQERPGDLQQMLTEMEREGKIEIIQDEVTLQKYTLNPINLLIRPSGKLQLVVHSIYNTCYTRPSLHLDRVKTSAEQLQKVEKMSKTDLAQAYRLLRVRTDTVFEQISGERIPSKVERTTIHFS